MRNIAEIQNAPTSQGVHSPEISPPGMKQEQPECSTLQTITQGDESAPRRAPGLTFRSNTTGDNLMQCKSDLGLENCWKAANQIRRPQKSSKEQQQGNLKGASRSVCASGAAGQANPRGTGSNPAAISMQMAQVFCALHPVPKRGGGSVHNQGEDEVAYTGGWRDLVTGIVVVLPAVIAGNLHPVRAFHLLRLHRDRHCCGLALVALIPLWFLPRRRICHRVVVIHLPSLHPSAMLPHRSARNAYASSAEALQPPGLPLPFHHPP